MSKKYSDPKEKHAKNFSARVNRDKHYDLMANEKLDEKIRERFRRKPYTVIHYSKKEEE